MISTPTIRATRFKSEDLLPGDVVLCSDDACFSSVYAAMYNGESFVGMSEADACACEFSADEFVDSLIGRFAFIIIRHQLAKCK